MFGISRGGLVPRRHYQLRKIPRLEGHRRGSRAGRGERRHGHPRSEYAYLAPFSALGVLSQGTRTRILVPLPGELVTSTSPPQNWARSFMPKSPKDPIDFDRSDSRNPIPSSSTTRRMSSSSRDRATDTDFACACRITLVRHSWKIL